MDVHKQKMFLAVDSFLEGVCIIRKDYFLKPGRREFYHYNCARVGVSMGPADQIIYPRIFEAVEDLNNSKHPYLNILFNAPDSGWKRPPNNGNDNDGWVRVCVEANHFLKRLYEECGYNLTVCVRGNVFRNTFEDGRYFPLTSDAVNLEFKVFSDGATLQRDIIMVPGLFGRHQLQAILTVSLEWQDPKPFFNGTIRTCSTSLLSLNRSRDFKIVASDEKCYICHSEILREMSPVFYAMLSHNMSERRNYEIRLEDFDGEVVSAFLKYAYEGCIRCAYVSCGLCFQLFSFAHKYEILDLEQATRELLENKDESWLDTETALDLYCFAKGLDNSNLAERAGSILKRRQVELNQLEDVPRTILAAGGIFS